MASTCPTPTPITTYTFHEANLTDVLPHAWVFLLGRRASRKTTWAKYLHNVLEAKQFDEVDVLCGNRVCRFEWRDLLKDPTKAHLVEKVEDKVTVMECILREQETKIQRLKNHPRFAKIPFKDVVIPQALRRCIILDDCEGHPSFWTSPTMRKLATYEQRHNLGVFVICVTNYFVRHFRPNYLLLTSNCNTFNQKFFWKRLKGYVKDEKAMNVVLNRMLKDGGITWLDVQGPTRQTRLFWARALQFPLAWNRHQILRRIREPPWKRPKLCYGV